MWATEIGHQRRPNFLYGFLLNGNALHNAGSLIFKKEPVETKSLTIAWHCNCWILDEHGRLFLLEMNALYCENVWELSKELMWQHAFLYGALRWLAFTLVKTCLTVFKNPVKTFVMPQLDFCFHTLHNSFDLRTRQLACLFCKIIKDLINVELFLLKNN